MRTLQLLPRHLLLLPLAAALLTGCDEPTQPGAQAEAEAGGFASAITASGADAPSPCTIDFTGKAPRSSSSFVFSPGYNVECNATFFPTVTPADPRLGPDPIPGHFHVFNGTEGPQWAGQHYLGGMDRKDVIQMTYDDGGTNTFDVLGICIHSDGTAINLGFMRADGSIGVYNDLSAGCWSLSDGSDHLTRLTIEGTGAGIPFVENITIQGRPNSSPLATAGGAYNGTEGAGIQFSGGESSDPDGDVLSYGWDFGDGTTATAANPMKVYADNGTYTVTLTVTDPLGATSTATATATITNAAPVVKFAATSATTFRAGGTLSLQGSFTDRGRLDAPWTYTIVWGDNTPNKTGTLSTQGAITASHRYTSAGTRSAYMTVKDKDAKVGTSAKIAVTVTP
jgi:hypothetical protein